MIMEQLLSVTETAKLLRISRTAVLKKIKTGALEARKIGNGYFINKDDLTNVSDREVSKSQKEIINASVKKTIDEYGETLRLLKDS